MDAPVKIPESPPEAAAVDLKETFSAATGGLVAASVLGFAAAPTVLMSVGAGVSYLLLKLLADRVADHD